MSAVARLTGELSVIADEVQATFGGLSAPQLNWKPAPEVWSVGQCIDHLIVSNSTYIPIIELVLAGKKPTSLWQNLPLLPALWGKLLIKQLAPDSKRKSKTAKVFEPSSSAIGPDIIARFVTHQQQMIGLLERTAQLELDRIIITSPAISFVTYSLADAYEIIVVHERRHLWQARRVMSALNQAA